MFGFDGTFKSDAEGSSLEFNWENQGYKAILNADLSNYSFQIIGIDADGSVVHALDGSVGE